MKRYRSQRDALPLVQSNRSQSDALPLVQRLSIALAVAVCALTATAQTDDDPVLMTINGIPVLRSEFEYSYNKNNADGVIDKKTVDEYVPLFVRFKLKVEAAKALGYDTVPATNRELYGYREQMILEQLVDSDYIERQARFTYDKTAERFGNDDLISCSHILVLLRQDADEAAQAAAKARIDSIYDALQAGADFAELARQCSDDKRSGAQGGRLGQFGKGMMIPDFEKAAYAMQPGELSEPFLSTVGWHIISMHERHPFESYEFHHDQILKFLDQRGIRKQSANALVDSLIRTTGRTRQQVMDSLFDAYAQTDTDMRYLAQEYSDGTLMYEVSKDKVWDKASRDSGGLQAYFLAHRSQYTWETPRFRGIVIYAADKKTLKQARRLIKDVPEEQWPTTIVEALNTDSTKVVRIEHGIFKQGDNGSVDRYAFKDKRAEPKQMKGLALSTTVGKMLSAPESYADVKGQVTTDYQQELERQWVEDLEARYPVEIDQDVLSTVNNH